MRKNYVSSCCPSTIRTAWRGSCGWTTSCPSSTKLGLKTIFLKDAVMGQTINPNVKETCHLLHLLKQLLCDKHLWFYIFRANVHGGCEDSIPVFQILFKPYRNHWSCICVDLKVTLGSQLLCDVKLLWWTRLHPLGRGNCARWTPSVC